MNKDEQILYSNSEHALFLMVWYINHTVRNTPGKTIPYFCLEVLSDDFKQLRWILGELFERELINRLSIKSTSEENKVFKFGPFSNFNDLKRELEPDDSADLYDWFPDNQYFFELNKKVVQDFLENYMCSWSKNHFTNDRKPFYKSEKQLGLVIKALYRIIENYPSNNFIVSESEATLFGLDGQFSCVMALLIDNGFLELLNISIIYGEGGARKLIQYHCSMSDIFGKFFGSDYEQFARERKEFVFRTLLDSVPEPIIFFYNSELISGSQRMTFYKDTFGQRVYQIAEKTASNPKEKLVVSTHKIKEELSKKKAENFKDNLLNLRRQIRKKLLLKKNFNPLSQDKKMLNFKNTYFLKNFT